MTKKNFHTFLGVAGFCQIWILGFRLMTKPLYEAIKGPDTEPLLWTRKQEKAFGNIK